MPKQNIAFISLLKPVDDIRSYHKLARSIHALTDHEIHCIGYPSQSLPQPSDIHFRPLENFPRLGLGRIKARLQTLKKTLQLKPKLIIVNSTELLLVTLVSKILFGSKIIYDIQENYFRNLWFQRVYPPVIKHLLAILIRTKEVMLSPFFDHFILAETCYAEEIKFIGNRFTILENKALRAITRSPLPTQKHRPQILFSGTITRNTGILHAIKLSQKLSHKTNHTLHVVGHCPEEKIRLELESLDHDMLHLHISPQPIPYSEIEHAISHADIGIVCYQTNPSNEHCMPTKVFEYAASGLPMIYEKGSHWKDFISNEGVGLAIDFNQINIDEISNFILTNLNVSPTKSVQALWSEEEEKWASLIQNLLIEK